MSSSAMCIKRKNSYEIRNKDTSFSHFHLLLPYACGTQFMNLWHSMSNVYSEEKDE